MLGPITIQRPYDVCPHCHRGCSPRDRELDVQGVTCCWAFGACWRWRAASRASSKAASNFESPAGIEVSAKAVERHAEAIGADIEAREQAGIQRAKQLELPEVCAPALPVLYMEMDGTGIPVVKTETEGRAGKAEGQPAHTREVKLGCVFTQTTTRQQDAGAR